MHSNHNFACSILIWVLVLGLALLMIGVQVGAQIAFVSYRDGNREIYVMEADGGNPRNLTNNPLRDNNPSWSPSGDHIAFESRRDGNWEIYVMDANGGNPQRLTRHRAHDWSPSWSPNGEHIAFDSSRGGNNEIYVMDTEGGNLRNLTNNNDAYDASPSWSPDGQRIAFASATKAVKAKDRLIFDIFVMDIDGGNLQKLTKDAESDYYPDWSRSVFAVSPAGKQILIWGWLKSESR